MIAWDASLDATRAVNHALPMLIHGDNLKVVAFHVKPLPDSHGEELGTDMALYLACQGIIIKVLQGNAKIELDNTLLPLALMKISIYW